MESSRHGVQGVVVASPAGLATEPWNVSPTMADSLCQFLKHVVASDLLLPELVNLSSGGATEAELASAPPLPNSLRDLLAWHNGLNLDVVRIHGVGDVVPLIQFTPSGDIEFASDPAGFTYILRRDGTVASFDHDGGEEKVVAQGVDDFLRGYIFGPRASDFSGEDWAREVDAAIGTG